MPTSESNPVEHSGTLRESHKGYDPRVISFYFALAVLQGAGYVKVVLVIHQELVNVHLKQ